MAAAPPIPRSASVTVAVAASLLGRRHCYIPCHSNTPLLRKVTSGPLRSREDFSFLASRRSTTASSTRFGIGLVAVAGIAICLWVRHHFSTVPLHRDTQLLLHRPPTIERQSLTDGPLHLTRDFLFPPSPRGPAASFVLFVIGTARDMLSGDFLGNRWPSGQRHLP